MLESFRLGDAKNTRKCSACRIILIDIYKKFFSFILSSNCVLTRCIRNNRINYHRLTKVAIMLLPYAQCILVFFYATLDHLNERTAYAMHIEADDFRQVRLPYYECDLQTELCNHQYIRLYVIHICYHMNATQKHPFFLNAKLDEQTTIIHIRKIA